MYFDPIYLLLTVPGLIISMVASLYVKSTFSRYDRVLGAGGMTGAQAADAMLRANGVFNVRINCIDGFLSDHFNPADNTLNLSSSVYNGRSLSAIGVACHEAGHALQKATEYPWLGMRSSLVPLANIGSQFSYLVLMAGLLLQMTSLLYGACILFGCAFLFTIVTLPVEWDASARAKTAMIQCGLLSPQEERHAASVLNAAFMTYVASAISALLTLLYYLFRAGLLGGRRRD